MPKLGWLFRRAAWVGAFLVFAGLGRPAEARNYPPVFNTSEHPSTKWVLPKGSTVEWKKMLARWQDGKACKSATCTSASWPSLVAKVKAASGDVLSEITLANSLINDKTLHPYIQDKPNWSRDEYWATAYEFLKKSGDCEDFAITKYMLLKAAGMPIENMRLFVVALRNLNGMGHNILVVYLGDSAWVLDNRTTKLVEAKYLTLEFQAFYSMNETAWWIHSPQ